MAVFVNTVMTNRGNEGMKEFKYNIKYTKYWNGTLVLEEHKNKSTTLLCVWLKRCCIPEENLVENASHLSNSCISCSSSAPISTSVGL